MDQYELIRTAHRVYGKSIRQIQRETGHHRVTIRKALRGLEPKYRRVKPVLHPVMGPVAETVKRWLREDRERPVKQRHTARRIYTRLVEEEGFQGSETTVRRWVREWKASQGWGQREAVVPLDPEAAREAEVDWGTAWVRMAGQRRRIKLFVMRSRYSGKAFVRAYPWERQEMFFDGHRHAFEYFGGVFPELVYDNLSLSVRRILRGKQRIEQERFVSFRSYYTYRARFCTPGQGREKGGVEGHIGYARRNFLVPVPEVADFQELNERLHERFQAQGRRRIRGREDARSIDERFEAERGRLLPLPETPFENTKILRVRADRYQTVNVDRNRYSVPGAYVGRWLRAHVGCDQVEIYLQDRKVVEHERIFANSKWQIDPRHYLDLIEQRVGAFERARPILQWRARWPRSYEVLLQTLRQKQGDNAGTREFVRILKLHRAHESPVVERAVEKALEHHCPGYESIRHLIGLESSPLRFVEPLAPDRIPGVTDQAVSQTRVEDFNALLTEAP